MFTHAPPSPPPPLSPPLAPPMLPPSLPAPPPSPPPLLNCTLDHLSSRGLKPFNYSVDSPDGTLHAEVSASFEFMLLNDEVSCYASGRQYQASTNMSTRWSCADVASYRTMTTAQSGGLLFGQSCPGIDGEIFGDRVADAHDMRVILVRFCPIAICQDCTCAPNKPFVSRSPSPARSLWNFSL